MKATVTLGALFALVASAAVPGAIAGATISAVPAPLVDMQAGVPPDGLSFVGRVYGQGSDGKVFVLLPFSGSHVGVIGGDGATTDLGVNLSDAVGPPAGASVGPDGRLWARGKPAGLSALTVEGAVQDIVLPTPEGGVAPRVTATSPGPDGRVWFLDQANAAIGAIDADGTDPVSYPAGGTADLSYLTAGPDGRVWFVRADGSVGAATTSGVVTDIGSIGGTPSVRPATFDGSVWFVRTGALVRLAPDGTLTVVVAAIGPAVALAPANGRMWVLDWSPTLPGPRLYGVSTDGTVRQTPIPVPYGTSVSTPFGDDDLKAYESLEPADGGSDLVGTTVGHAWRSADPGPTPQLATGSLILHRDGYDELRVSVVSHDADGTPSTGQATVALWRDDDHDAYGRSALRASKGSVSLDANGRGFVYIPVVPSMLPTDPGFGTNSTFGASAELGTTSSTRGFSSPISGLPQLKLTATMAKVAKIYAYVFDRPMFPAGNPVGDEGALYWTKRFASGTPRVTLARSLVSTAGWRQQRVRAAYEAWLLREPDAGGLAYWTKYLEAHTTAQLDLAIGSTAGARDASGATNAWRARHLASALGTNDGPTYKARLDAGMRWSALVASAYASGSAYDARAHRVLDRSSNLPSTTTFAQVRAALVRTHDEREPTIQVASTLR